MLCRLQLRVRHFQVVVKDNLRVASVAVMVKTSPWNDLRYAAAEVVTIAGLRGVLPRVCGCVIGTVKRPSEHRAALALIQASLRFRRNSSLAIRLESPAPGPCTAGT